MNINYKMVNKNSSHQGNYANNIVDNPYGHRDQDDQEKPHYSLCVHRWNETGQQVKKQSVYQNQCMNIRQISVKWSIT